MYVNILNQPVPQTKRLNDRQVRNSAGGFSYNVSIWEQLDRFLLIGTVGGTYYLSELTLTKQNFGEIEKCIQADGVRVVSRVCEISKSGRAVKNDPAIFVLALVFKLGDEAARRAASDAIVTVCRTGTHLLSFAAEVEGLGRGWGRTLKRGVGNWFTSKSDERLAYLAIKYAQRNGWSLRDLLRLSKPKMGLNPVAMYITRGAGGHPFIDAALSLKLGNATQAAEKIREFKLPREAVPSDLLNVPVIWEALLQDMPMTAMIRNLGKMTSIGLIAPLSRAEDQVVARLWDRDAIRAARVHPLSLLVALDVYQSGHGVKGALSWTPSTRVVSALNDAVGLAMESAPSTGLRTLVAVDVSGSMQMPVPGHRSLMLHQISACMALCATRSERVAQVIAFDTKTYVMDVKGRRLDDAAKAFSRYGGGTDIAQPMLWALAHKLDVDLVQIYTDSETWAGRTHPDKALEEYRQKRNSKVKVAVVSMTANRYSVHESQSPNVLQCVGFDASLPQVLSAFAGGKASSGETEDEG